MLFRSASIPRPLVAPTSKAKKLKVFISIRFSNYFVNMLTGLQNICKADSIHKVKIFLFIYDFLSTNYSKKICIAHICRCFERVFSAFPLAHRHTSRISPHTDGFFRKFFPSFFQSFADAPKNTRHVVKNTSHIF